MFYLLFLLWKIVNEAGGQGRHAWVFWLLAIWLREMAAVIAVGSCWFGSRSTAVRRLQVSDFPPARHTPIQRSLRVAWCMLHVQCDMGTALCAEKG